MAVSKTGLPVYADTAGISRLAAAMRRSAPQTWAACRKGLRAAGELTATDARGRAPSARVAGSIRVRVTPGGNVKVRAGGAIAPEGVPIENHGKGFVRHPTFAAKDSPAYVRPGNWTDKHSHPAFLTPAFDATVEQGVKMMDDAVMAAVAAALEGL